MAVVSWLSNDNEVTKNKIRDDNIAPIELNALSASKTYTVGKPFVLDSDGKLYKATQQIDQGSAIITSGENANCEEVSNGAEGIFGTKQDIFNLNSAVGNLASSVGRAEGNIQTLAEIKANISDLGTASAKNSTSVVTDSSDLVESGAVKDIIGWGNKNLCRGLETGSINQSTGQDQTGTNKRTIGIVSIKKGSTVTISGFNADSTPQYRIFYFSDGVYQSNEVLNYDDTTLTATVTVGSTINGIRLQITPAKVDDTHFMIEYGSTATEYEPYHESVADSLEDKIDWNEAERYVSENMLAINSMSFHRTNHRVDSISIPKLNKNTKYRLTVKYSDVSVATGDEELFFIRFGLNQSVSTTTLHPRTDISGNQYFNLATVNSDIPDINKNLYLGFNSLAQTNDSLTVDLYLVPVEIHDNVDLTQNKADNSIIGTVEDGATASQAYAVGQHFIRDGAFCTCTQAIAQGGTFTLNTNYTAGDVADTSRTVLNEINLAANLGNLLPNNHQMCLAYVNQSVTAVLTNSEFSVTGKIVACRNVNNIDWFGEIGTDRFVMGRVSANGTYVSHTIIK